VSAPSYTVALTAHNLTRVLTTAAMFASTDRIIPTINRVEVSVSDGYVIAAATDRFRMGVCRVKHEVDTDTALPPQGWSAAIDLDDLRRLCTIIRPRTRYERSAGVSFTVGGDSLDELTFTAGTITMTATGHRERFADWRKIMRACRDNAVDPAPSVPVNPAYLDSFGKASWESDDRLVIFASRRNRPITITIGEHFFGVLMPVMVDDDGVGEESLSSWDRLFVEGKAPASDLAAASNTSTVVPAIPSVTLPEGPYYTQRPVGGHCNFCDRQAVAYISWMTNDLAEDGFRDGWTCPEHMVGSINSAFLGTLAPGTDVTVELDTGWLRLAGVGDLPTFVRRAS
jgi:hypothetical protein